MEKTIPASKEKITAIKAVTNTVKNKMAAIKYIQ